MAWLLMLVGLAQADVLEVIEQTATFRAQRETGAPTIPTAAYLAAEAGEHRSGTAPVAGSPARKGWGVSVLPHPIEVVWKTVNDELAYPPHTRLSHSILLEGQAGVTGRLVFHYLPLNIASDRWWVTRVEHSAELFRRSAGRLWEMAWNDENEAGHLERHADSEAAALAAKGFPLAFTRGAWLLTSIDEGHTLLEYHSHADPGGNLPAGGVSRFAAGGILVTLSAVETLAASGPDGSFVRPDGTSMP